MQIKRQQSIVGLVIGARSWVKFPEVLRDVHRAIKGRSDLGWCRRREESAALKDGNGCHFFTVKLILSCLPSAFVYSGCCVFPLILSLSPSVSQCPRKYYGNTEALIKMPSGLLFTATPKVMDGKKVEILLLSSSNRY